jgi:hypothetical protein
MTDEKGMKMTDDQNHEDIQPFDSSAVLRDLHPYHALDALVEADKVLNPEYYEKED